MWNWIVVRVGNQCHALGTSVQLETSVTLWEQVLVCPRPGLAMYPGLGIALRTRRYQRSYNIGCYYRYERNGFHYGWVHSYTKHNISPLWRKQLSKQYQVFVFNPSKYSSNNSSIDPFSTTTSYSDIQSIKHTPTLPEIPAPQEVIEEAVEEGNLLP